MQTYHPIRNEAARGLMIFVGALAAWLVVLGWRHDESHLIVGVLISGTLAVGGTALSYVAS